MYFPLRSEELEVWTRSPRATVDDSRNALAKQHLILLRSGRCHGTARGREHSAKGLLRIERWKPLEATRFSQGLSST
jgi:hypothetical protein